jgi:transposase
MAKRDLRKTPRAIRDEIHAKVVDAVLNKKQTAADVANTFGVSIRSVFGWLALFKEGGKRALISGKAKGSPRALTQDEEIQLIGSIYKKTPEDFNLTGMLWSREHCVAVAKKLFRKKVSLSAMGRLLRRRNMSCQKPMKRASERNKKLIDEWKNKTFPKVAKEAKKRRASIFFSDETGVRSDSQGGTTWGKKGRTPVVTKTGKRLRLNVIGASSRRGDFRFMIYEDSLSGRKFVEFLKRLMHKRRRPVYLVVDSLAAHKSPVVRKYVDSLNGKLTLVFLPPYAPELNPQEYGWNVLKGRKVSAARVSTKSDLVRAVRGCLKTWQKNPNTVKGFFRSKYTLYTL